mmetsp:Transcript_21981/g.48826  ORF Transcript_21981/g.48826 Transcript_21981/m.48826 type:complete len:147 (+) Transcript_21981:25-465(+)
MREVLLTWSLHARRLRRKRAQGANRLAWIDPCMSTLSTWQQLWLHTASNNALGVLQLHFFQWLSAYEAAKQMFHSKMLHAQVIKLRREHKAAAQLLAANRGIDQETALCARVLQAWAGTNVRKEEAPVRGYGGESKSRSAHDSFRY